MADPSAIPVPSSSPAPGKRPPTALLWRCAKSLLRVALLLLIMLAWFQRSLIYHPAKARALPGWGSGLPQTVLDLTVKSHDGLTLHGWLALSGPKLSSQPVNVKAALAQERPLVIVFPGNGGNRSHRVHLLHTLCQLGADALIFDHRGYGDNAGHPTEAHLARDARSLWNHLTGELDVPARRIVLYGESLGGGVACRLAGELGRENIEPGGLILQSTFNSLVDAGRYHFPLLPVSLILIDRFNSAQHVRDVRCPILQLHGQRDRIVPLSLGQKLFAACPAQSTRGMAKHQVILPNTDHNDVYGPDLPQVITALKSFLKDVSAEVPQ